jgi:hypothetical protein
MFPQVLDSYVEAAGLCDSSNSTYQSLLLKLRKQLQQSGLLEHIPALLTDAALQLQAAAGIWPATGQGEARGVMQSIPREQAECNAALVFQLLEIPVFPAFAHDTDSMLDAHCVLPAEHLVLACMQYLSTVLQDRQHRIDPAWRPSEVQEMLATESFKLSRVCVNLVSGAMMHEPEMTMANAHRPVQSCSNVHHPHSCAQPAPHGVLGLGDSCPAASTPSSQASPGFRHNQP